MSFASPTPQVSRSGWQRVLPPLCLLVGLPVLLVAGFTVQLVFAVSMPWRTALLVSHHHWFVPFIVAIAGWAVARAFPMERGRFAWAAPMHLAVAALVIALAGRVEKNVFPRAASAAHSTSAAAPLDAGLARAHRPNATEHRQFFALLVSSRWQLHLAVLAVSMSLTHAWRLYQRVQERDRRALELTASLSRAKLEALRLQLQPHFLFNTLHTISHLVHRDPAAADEMITNLSELLRRSLEDGEQEVPLRRELEILDCYFAIEQVRLGRRLTITRHIDEAALDGLVPLLVLQPLAENAVRHGLEPRTAGGTITVHAERHGDVLRLEVTDDGRGLKPADADTERRGIGLTNTEERLRELHGSAATLELRAPESGGVSVRIELPFRRA
jgi:two-component system, LytTR family, sensor kinase